MAPLEQMQADSRRLTEQILDILNKQDTHPAVALEVLAHAGANVVAGCLGDTEEQSRAAANEYYARCFEAMAEIAFEFGSMTENVAQCQCPEGPEDYAFLHIGSPKAKAAKAGK